MFKALTMSIKALFVNALSGLGNNGGGNDGDGGHDRGRRRRRRGVGGAIDTAKDFFKPGNLGKLLKAGGKLLGPLGLILTIYDTVTGAFEAGAKSIEDGAGPMEVLFAAIKGGIMGFINGLLDIPKTLATMFGLGEEFDSMSSWFSNLFGTEEAKAKEGATEMNTPDESVAAPDAPAGTSVTKGTPSEPIAQTTSTVGAGSAGSASDVSSSSFTTPTAFKPKGSDAEAQLLAEMKKLNKLNQAQLDTLKNLSTKSSSIGVVNVYNNAKHNA